MLLGCIADDLTGATDLALMLTREGLRTVQSAGIPGKDLDPPRCDALVVALKTRSIPAEDAVRQSLDAARRLRALGARRLLFKYCSTFDSTDRGNIGPVAEALLDFAGGEGTIACPAFPRAGRTVYAGNLFVNGVPLAESPMRDHPLNPMRDSDLRRVLARQTQLEVGHVAFDDVNAGPERIGAAFAREVAAGRRVAIVDAVTDTHLRSIGRALADLPLLTGGSGIGIGLPAAYLEAGLLPGLAAPPEAMQAPDGRSAILAGSCSEATRRQVAAAQAAGIPAFRLDATRLADGEPMAEDALAWAGDQAGDRPILVYSSAEPDVVAAIQARLGRDAAGRMVEDALASVASGLAEKGVTRFVVAGGETAGAVVERLNVQALSIGPEIDPGVPWTRTIGRRDLALALKSGNFGSTDFFLKAWSILT